jgi:hypothetical protein
LEEVILAQGKLKEQTQKVPTRMAKVGGCLVAMKVKMLKAENEGGREIFERCRSLAPTCPKALGHC